MIWEGKEVPIIFFYQNGKLVWDYVLPEGVKGTKYGFKELVKMWRPDDWGDKKFYACMDLTEGGGTYADIYEVFEAGADAMLGALKEGAKYLHNTGTMPYGYVLGRSMKLGEKGWLVFIPDEERS